MKVLIVSDTHRKNDNYLKVVRRHAPLDLVIHCGDVEGSEYLISESAGCPSIVVMGNNDFFSNLPREVETEYEGVRMLITHGHNYYIGMGNEMIKEDAKARGFQMVIYGHTHRPEIDVEEDMIALNPGSLSYPRQEGKEPSYIIMELEEGKKPEIELHYLPSCGW